ncbi:hypothetical protein LIER_25584 [Lithospermum erythrorhizon]|uniref:Mitochondrial protein n=1 Tax=Lithospermum erythrorhizon TaxID=34254 RepID=A0AAV3R910_LITER
MYQQLVGKLIYVSHTKPDIAFAVSVVSQYMHDPHQGHLDAVYRILRYLKQSSYKGLLFKKTEDRSIQVFIYADWAGSIDDRQLTSGYCTMIWENLITWRSKKHNVVARSSVEAEFRAMAHGIFQHDRTKHVVVDRYFIKEKIENNIIKIKHVNTGQQLADILIKGLSEKTFNYLLNKLGLIDIYHPA